MRLGFVAASLLAHLGVVGLALYAVQVTPAAPAPKWVAPQSGLVSVELDAADVAQTDRSDVSAQRVEPETARRIEKGKTVDRVAAEQRPAMETAAPPKEASRPMPTAGAPSAKRQLAKRNTQLEVPRESSKRADDWMSIDQQLPDPTTGEKVTTEPERDELVERLLAKEREKTRVQQKEESNRLSSQRTKIEPAAAAPGVTPAPAPTVEQNVGASHQSGDVWVELTRWLPRAASSDQAWEQLPADTRLDVEVQVRADPDAPLVVKAVGRVPAIVERLLTTTGHLMQRGRFAHKEPIERRFALRIRLSQTADRELWIAHTTPDPPKPGVGSFVSPTGRRFDVWVADERF